MTNGYQNLGSDIIPEPKDDAPKKRTRKKKTIKATPVEEKRVVNRKIPERCEHCGSRLNLDKHGFHACYSCGFTTR